MSKERFRRKLAESLGYLQTSAQCFDMGIEAEAIRLATTLRVLFHSNPPGSVSILKHLKMDDVEVLSTAAPGVAVQHLAFVNITINLASAARIKAVPKMGDQFFPVPANEWWSVQPVYEFKGKTYTRAQVIKAAANQDGGAHVDLTLKDFYEDMEAGAQGMSLNGQNLVYAYTRAAPEDGQAKTEYCRNMHYAMLRQFSHEVLATAGHFGWLQKP
jgi:hypothetical protein